MTRTIPTSARPANAARLAEAFAVKIRQAYGQSNMADTSATVAIARRDVITRRMSEAKIVLPAGWLVSEFMDSSRRLHCVGIFDVEGLLAAI